MQNLSGSDRSHLDAVLETSLDPAVVMRPDGTVAAWSSAAERCFGWSLADTEGHPMSALIIPPQHRDAHEAGLAHFLKTGEGPVLDQHIEITAVNRSGDEFPVELSITYSEQFGEPLFIGFVRDISERKRARRRQEMLLRELTHRVKNMLAVVSGIAQQTAQHSASVDEFQASFLGRLGALAAAHELLALDDEGEAPLSGLLGLLLGPYGEGDQPRISYDGPPLKLSSKRLVSISMVIHELLTNALKYGALSDAGGTIEIGWRSLDPRRSALYWRESGLVGIAAPGSHGFGLRMIDLTASHELGGATDWHWHPSGLEFGLDFIHSDAHKGSSEQGG